MFQIRWSVWGNRVKRLLRSDLRELIADTGTRPNSWWRWPARRPSRRKRPIPGARAPRFRSRTNGFPLGHCRGSRRVGSASARPRVSATRPVGVAEFLTTTNDHISVLATNNLNLTVSPDSLRLNQTISKSWLGSFGRLITAQCASGKLRLPPLPKPDSQGPNRPD